MYSPRLYKYRYSYVLYIPTEHPSVRYSLHTLFWYRHTHMTFPPPDYITIIRYDSRTYKLQVLPGHIHYKFFQDIYVTSSSRTYTLQVLPFENLLNWSYTHLWHFSKSQFNLKSDRVNLVTPAYSPIECLLDLPNVLAIQYKLGLERLTRHGNSNVIRLPVLKM